ncbi:putative Qde-2-interacting protein [Seiridium cardinale]
MEDKPMHAGLLRDETLFLRQIFGYADTREIGRNLSLRGSASKLPASSISDLLLVAIDIDTREGYDQIISNQQFHVGVSLFDSRSLETSGATVQDDYEPSESGIKSLQFTIGDSPYCKRAAEKFLFRQSESILISELKPRLEQAVSARDVVLVLHGAEQDLEVLKNLRIDLHSIFVVDTVKAAQHPLGLHYRYSLEKLLEALGIPFTNLHAAGNDAHFALRALLMIVVKDAESQPSTPSITTLIETLKSIALGPRPPSCRELLNQQEEGRRQGKPKAEQNSESKKNYWLKRHAKAKRKATRRLESENQTIGLASPPNDSPNEMEEDNTESALFEGT